MLSQDANGAMFLALDAETGKEVLLQRFFPFGVGSGGLGGSELESYNLALERMKSIEHRSLRRVLDGGCDPVDGIPFLIFEGREGVTLADFFSSGPINTEQGVVLVEYALKLMLEIEKLFGDKMDWLMMDASGVSCGPAHMAVVTKDGRLYTWGRGDRGQLGHDLVVHKESVPRLVKGGEEVEDGSGGGVRLRLVSRPIQWLLTSPWI